jgi:WD40 repeat protein
VAWAQSTAAGRPLSYSLDTERLDDLVLVVAIRIFSVKFSADSNFVLSGSDDTNIRIWKSEASKKLSKVRRWLEQRHRVSTLTFLQL